MNHNESYISKKISDIKIIFMGTPGFAVASLKALYEAGFNIAAVVTAPDKPAGRGMHLHESEVKKFARDKGLHILQPVKLRDENFIKALQEIKADLQVVVAFRMLPEIVWNMPPMGTINVHASLLPQYRGAAPINWAIINGEKETGVTTFKLKHEIDTGDILLQEKIQINENETAGELHDKLKETGASVLVKTINGIMDGSLNETPQQSLLPTNELKHAPKIFTDTCKIDFSKTCNEVHNLIRGLSPYPGAFTFLNNKMLKIFSAEKNFFPHQLSPGSFETDNKTYLRFACADGFINITSLQLEGKKKMNIIDFLRGWRN